MNTSTRPNTQKFPIASITIIVILSVLLVSCGELDCNSEVVGMSLSHGDYPPESTLIVSYERAYSATVTDSDGKEHDPIEIRDFGVESTWNAYVLPSGTYDVTIAMLGKKWTTQIQVLEDRRRMLCTACTY